MCSIYDIIIRFIKGCFQPAEFALLAQMAKFVYVSHSPVDCSQCQREICATNICCKSSADHWGSLQKKFWTSWKFISRRLSTAPWRTPEETVSVLSNTNENVDGKHVIGGSIVQWAGYRSLLIHQWTLHSSQPSDWIACSAQVFHFSFDTLSQPLYFLPLNSLPSLSGWRVGLSFWCHTVYQSKQIIVWGPTSLLPLNLIPLNASQPKAPRMICLISEWDKRTSTWQSPKLQDITIDN